MKTRKEIKKLEEYIKYWLQKEDEDIKQIKKDLEVFKGKEYTTNEAIEQYEKFLVFSEKYIIDEQAKRDFEPYYNQIKKQVNILKAGKRAEKATFDSIKLWNVHVRYLANARFVYDDIDTEEDLIIIAPTGIFSIEIKNWKTSAILNRNGILISNENKNNNIDIINQIKRHCFCLNKILVNEMELCGIQDKNFIHPIILWQNNFSKLKDEFLRIPICCANTLEYEILNYKKYKRVLGDEDIEKIYYLLLKKQCHERKYPSIITGDYFDAFLLAMKAQYASKRRPLEEKISEIEAKKKQKLGMLLYLLLKGAGL